MSSGNLRALAILVTCLVILDALSQPAILVGALADPALFRSLISPNASTIDGTMLGFKLLTMVVFAWWIYAAGRNLVEADLDHLDFTPGARIWWFAVPFANLVKPFQGMRELWNASRGHWPYDENTILISVWWALWLLAGFSATFAQMGSAGDAPNPTLYVIAIVIQVVRAPFALAIVWGITMGQRRVDRSELSEVFG